MFVCLQGGSVRRTSSFVSLTDSIYSIPIILSTIHCQWGNTERTGRVEVSFAHDVERKQINKGAAQRDPKIEKWEERTEAERQVFY